MSEGHMNDNPLTLQEMACMCICKNLDYIGLRNRKSQGERVLKPGIVLPSNTCDLLLECLQRFPCILDDNVASLFRDTSRTTLNSVSLHNSFLSSKGFKDIMRHKPYALATRYCGPLAADPHKLLLRYGENLRSLELSFYSHELANPRISRDGPFALDIRLVCPRLQLLALHGVEFRDQLHFAPLTDLYHLDLSSCNLTDFNLDELVRLPHLRSLILCEVWPLEPHLPVIRRLHRLRLLDISNLGTGFYDRPAATLEMLVQSLPELNYLDISGTNLTGAEGSDVPSLAARAERPLKFLGLYNTENLSFQRSNIPALEVAGNENELQLLTAARYCSDRACFLRRVMTDMFKLSRLNDIPAVLNVVFTAMENHLKVDYVQHIGFNILLRIIKLVDISQKMGISLRRRFVEKLLNALEAHMLDDMMLYKGCIILTRFTLEFGESDLLYEYERAVGAMLRGIVTKKYEGLLKNLAIRMLNVVVVRADGPKRLFLGKAGIVGIMLAFIADVVATDRFDDSLVTAWSILGETTNGTALNCKRLFDGYCMDHFLSCFNLFPNRSELLKKMLRVLYNVAQVKCIIPRLMSQQYIEVFDSLLDFDGDDIEVSCYSASILACIASSGADAWTIDSPEREYVLEHMVTAIERWDISSKQHVTKNSFEAVLSLVGCFKTPQCQHWAVWAIANLTKLQPDDYCNLLIKKNGLKQINELKLDPRPYERIKQLASMVIEQCASCKRS